MIQNNIDSQSITDTLNWVLIAPFKCEKAQLRPLNPNHDSTDQIRILPVNKDWWLMLGLGMGLLNV